MFQPNASDAPASPVSPAPKTEPAPRREKVRHLLYGSLDVIDRTIIILHKLGYAEPIEWSDPEPSGRPKEWMVILTKQFMMS